MRNCLIVTASYLSCIKEELDLPWNYTNSSTSILSSIIGKFNPSLYFSWRLLTNLFVEFAAKYLEKKIPYKNVAKICQEKFGWLWVRVLENWSHDRLSLVLISWMKVGRILKKPFSFSYDKFIKFEFNFGFLDLKFT